MTCPASITYYNVHVLRNTSDCLVLTNTNAAEKSSDKISVFPNPTTGDITIRQTIPHCNLQIYNTLGQVVLNETLQDGENKISLPAYLPNGIYYLKTFNENRVLYANKLVLLRE